MQIFNKSAGFDYQLIGDKFEAGISLKGVEAKSLREGRGDLSASFVKFIDGEFFLVNANVPAVGIQNYDATRSRKLLLHKTEIVSLNTKSKQQNLQIVPTKLYNKQSLRPDGQKGRFVIKVELSFGKPKRKFEKRDAGRKKDIAREVRKELKI